MTEVKEWTVLDRVRDIKFTGAKIGHASTKRPFSVRWTEITIFKTESGKYVVQREGKSSIYHRAEKSCTRGEAVRNSDIGDDAVPCRDCQPPSLDTLDQIEDEDQSTYFREVTMSAADVTSDPERIIRILSYKGSMTGVATEAVAKARENDPDLDRAMQVQVVQ